MPPYNGKILVVDDEKDFVSAIENYFVEEGYEMLKAYNGADALKIISEKQPWLVLLDIKMPGIDGIEVLKRVRKQFIGTKVIVITAYDEDNRKTVEDIGVEGFLSKPCGIGMLEDKIKELVKNQCKDLTAHGSKKAKAKLLFIEGDSKLKTSLNEFFSDSDKCAGDYTLAFADTPQAAEEQLKSFRPDFALINYTTTKNSNYLTLVMKSQYKPLETMGWGLDIANHHERIATKIFEICEKHNLLV